MIYYLKVNREEPYTYNNLRQWIQAIAYENRDYFIYILCDKKVIEENIMEKVALPESKYAFLSSGVSDDLMEAVKHISDMTWQKAAIAHLTTFEHAKKMGYREFWNIDADDTLFCLPAERTAECLRAAERYANAQHIHLFSLDMWVSRDHDLWSFGITYCDNRVDWVELIQKHSRDENYNRLRENREPVYPMNIDRFMGYLRAIKISGFEDTEYRIETYYFENLRFAHYSNDFLRRPLSSGLWKYKNREILSPLISTFFNRPDLGCQRICDEVIQLDIGISDEEAASFLRTYGNDDGAFLYFDMALKQNPVDVVLSYRESALAAE